MLLNLVWDKTASGTERSKTVNGLQRSSASHLGMGPDCLLDSEEQNREQTAQLSYFAPRCARGSLLPYKYQGKRGYTEFLKIIENQEKPRKLRKTRKTKNKSRKPRKTIK